MEWEIGAECLACVLIVLVLCFSRENFIRRCPRRAYTMRVWVLRFSTLLNIATVVLMGVPGLLPRWLCYTLNMLYFTFFPLLEAALTYYMAYLIHGRGPCFTRVAICLGVMLAAALAVVFTTRSQVGCFIWTRRAHMCAVRTTGCCMRCWWRAVCCW